MRFSFLFSVLVLFFSSAVVAEDLYPPELIQGLTLFDDGQLLEAHSHFKDYYLHHPEEKEAAFLLALSKWKMMWISTYNREDKQAVADLLEKVKTICEPMIEKDNDSRFYYAAAIGLQAQMAATGGDWWQTAQLGKKMKKHAQEILKDDPEYYKADYLLGSFNYFADALPGAVKFLRSLLFLPGGNRKEGLKQLIVAFEKGGILEGEAGRTLAIIYTYYEKRPDFGTQMCDNVLTLHPKCYEVGLYKGVNLYFEKSWEKAEESLRNVRKQILTYSELHNSKGVIPLYMPLEREVRYWISRSLIQQKKYDEAEVLLRELCDPEIHQPYWLMRGVLLSQAQIDYQAGRPEEAEKKIDKVLNWKNERDAHDKAKRLEKKEGKIDVFDIDFL